MNRIDATVTAIESFENITIVSFEAAGQPMRMMALELNSRLGIGSKVTLGVKASNISIAKEMSSMVSISNQLSVTIESVNNGRLLSSIKFSFAGSLIESIITRESALRMNLQAGLKIIALIKSSELSILEIK